MSSRRTGIEDLKSDLICRVFAPPDMDEKGGNVVKRVQIGQTAANVKVNLKEVHF